MNDMEFLQLYYEASPQMQEAVRVFLDACNKNIPTKEAIMLIKDEESRNIFLQAMGNVIQPSLI